MLNLIMKKDEELMRQDGIPQKKSMNLKNKLNW